MSTKFRTGTLALAVGLALGTAPSFAAGFAEEAAKKESIERIAVVGSRSAPRSVAESPVPIDIIGGDELGKNASSDMVVLTTVHKVLIFRLFQVLLSSKLKCYVMVQQHNTALMRLRV